MCKKYQDLSLYKNPKGFRGRGVFFVQLWWLVDSTIFRASPQFMYGWRRFLLRCFGAEIGKNVLIRSSVKVVYPWKLKIGDNSWIGDDVNLYSLGEIAIGKNAVISQKGYICTGGHDYSKESFDIFSSAVLVEDEAWLATDVFVAPGVTVGKGAVVGARSVVLENLPEGMICYGAPARPIKRRK